MEKINPDALYFTFRLEDGIFAVPVTNIKEVLNYEPCTKVPAAIMTSLSYPGIAQGSGVTKLSTGAAACMPSQKAQSASGLLSSTDWIISCLSVEAGGTVLKPSFS